VSAHADRKAVQDLAEHYAAMILEKQPECVMCQGEFCLSYHVIERLKKAGVRVVAACSERVVEEVYGKTGTEKLIRVIHVSTGFLQKKNILQPWSRKTAIKIC